MSDNTCTIRSNGSGRYYISMGAFRKTNDYATPQRAKHAAEKMGMTVLGELPDPNALSIARKCKLVQVPGMQTLQIVLGDDNLMEFHARKDVLAIANPILKRLGYKPLRITHNMLNPSFGEFLIDEDTPAYCDPGCESYHTM